MNKHGAFTEKLVEEYINLKVDAQYGIAKEEKDIKLRLAMKEMLYKEIQTELVEDIYEMKKAEIIEDGKKAIQDIEEKKKRSQLKFILIEGIILGLITGILVNQITDIISYLKGSTNYIATSIIIISLILLGIVFAFIVYLSKIEDYFLNKGE